MRITLPLLAALLAGACGEKIDAVQEQPCASAGAVTHAAQIQPLLAQYCTRCHAQSVAGSARGGAPPAANLDSHAGAAALAAEIDKRVQSGSMPPAEPKPTAAERETFHCWVAQGAKER